MPATVMSNVGCGEKSRMVCPSKSWLPGTVKPSVAVTFPASTAAAIGSALPVEPGSYGVLITVEVRKFPSVASGSAGSTVVESAMTITSPVFTSITTAFAHSASYSAARAPRVSCANHWASLSTVRRRSAPSTAGTSSSGALGMRTPSAPTSNVRVPGVPVMTSSWLSSRPSRAVPSPPMKPMMLPATDPFG